MDIFIRYDYPLVWPLEIAKPTVEVIKCIFTLAIRVITFLRLLITFHALYLTIITAFVKIHTRKVNKFVRLHLPSNFNDVNQHFLKGGITSVSVASVEFGVG